MFLENGFVGLFDEFVLEIGDLRAITTPLEALKDASLGLN